MTPAQLQEHSTSSAGGMQGEWAGSEPALLPQLSPVPSSAAHGQPLLAGSSWITPGLPGAQAVPEGSAAGNVHSPVWARCGLSPQAHLPRASLLRRREQQLRETPSLSPLESRALGVWSWEHTRRCPQLPARPAQTGHSLPGPARPRRSLWPWAGQPA